MTVVVDADGLIVLHSLLGRRRERSRSGLVEGELDDILVAGRLLRGDRTFGGGHVGARADDRAVLCQLLDRVVKNILADRAVVGIRGVAALIRLGDEVEGTRRSELSQDRIGVRDARDLDADTVRAFLVDICLGRVLLDTLLQLIDRIVHVRRGRGRLVGLVRDGDTAGEVKTGVDVSHRPGTACAPSGNCSVAHEHRNDNAQRNDDYACFLLHNTYAPCSLWF